MTAGLGEAALARAIADGSWDAMVARTLATPEVAAALDGLARTAGDAAYVAADEAARGIGARYGAFFVDRLDPAIANAVRTMTTKQTQRFSADVVEGLRRAVGVGLEQGIGPRATARLMRGVVGLGPKQVKAVANYRLALESGDFAKARGYQLRDHRYAHSGNLSPDRIDTMVDAYQRRMVGWTAETNARTMALEAQRVGQQESWRQAAADGVIDGVAVEKEWVATLDNRVRDEHAAMNGATAPLDGQYSNGDSYPGESDPWNCRCAEVYRVVRGIA
jgi:hypothetical protein